MKTNIAACGAALGLLALAGASHAATYTFSFSGANDSGSGTLTGVLDSPLTGITGTIDGATILGFSTYGLTSALPPGNTLTTADPHVDYNGIAFYTAGDAFNIYYNSTAPVGFFLIQQSTDPTPNDPNAPYGESISFTTSAPEPASWAMMIVGLGLAGATLRRRSAAPVRG